MSISLTPASPRATAVGVADDPYKKYWWLILLGFAVTGAWLSAPMMDGSVGSTHVDPNKPAADAAGEAGLASAAVGGVGHAYDLSMGTKGSKTKSALDAPESMLFQAPEDASAGAAAGGAPIGTASGGGASGSLASALKNIGQSKESGGWGGEKAQRGFASPQLSGGSLGGLGAVSGGHGGSSSSGAFGTRNAQVQGSAGHGLVDDSAAESAATAGRAAMGALGQTAANANRSALSRSNDAAAGGMNRIFDGSRGQNQISVGGGPGDASGGAYAALDQSPVNLKINPDSLDAKKITAPPGTNVPATQSGNSGQQMAMMIGGMMISAIAGGMIGGMAGQMVAMAGMMAMQTMMQQQQSASAAKQQQAQQNINNGTH